MQPQSIYRLSDGSTLCNCATAVARMHSAAGGGTDGGADGIGCSKQATGRTTATVTGPADVDGDKKGFDVPPAARLFVRYSLESGANKTVVSN